MSDKVHLLDAEEVSEDNKMNFAINADKDEEDRLAVALTKADNGSISSSPRLSFKEKSQLALQNPNFSRLFLVSLSFLGMYIALYSVQNITADMFKKEGYASLGNYAIACQYLSEGFGSIFCVFIIMKYGATKSMARFALMNIPFIASLIIPAVKTETSEGGIFSPAIVYPLVLIASALNGFGMGMVQPASGNYVADCATTETKGFYFAFF